MKKKELPASGYDIPVNLYLLLDKRTKRERVIIGEALQVQLYLCGVSGAEVLYDQERKLGTFLFEHNRQSAGEWNEYAGSILMESLSRIFRSKENERAAWEYIDEKQNSNDPISIFVAHRCRYWYQSGKNSKAKPDEKSRDFSDSFMGLVKSFEYNLWPEKRNYSVQEVFESVGKRIQRSTFNRDSNAFIWYPPLEQYEECLIVHDSFYPALFYYLRRLKEWGYCFCSCVNCGSVFLAESLHYSLCSEACRKEKNRQNKREFDERARENGYDIDYKNVSQRMRNRLNKLRKASGIPQEKIEKAVLHFKGFRTEAIKRKKQIKKSSGYKDFRNWLFEQERLFEEVCAH